MAMCLCFFFLLSLSFSIHTQARDTHFFSKFSHQQTTKTAKEVDTHESNVVVSPAQSPKAAVVEHGYGLYGGENTRYPPMTVDPVKTGYGFGKGKPFVSMEELRNEKQGMSDTRFFENGNRDVKGTRVVDENSYSENRGNGNGNKNEYVTEKQGMSDTRFLENGKYYYDVNRDVKAENSYEGNKGYATEKQGVSTHVVDENSYPEYTRNGNNNEYVAERQGMSDTRFPENDQYYNDVGQDFEDENTYNGNGYVTEKQGMSTHVEDENSYPAGNRRNGNKNGYVTEKQGMSDTRFLENGKYFYDVNQDENTYKRNGYVAEKQVILDENSYPESHQGNGNKNEYVTERQGLSDTKFLDNGKSYYDVNRDFKDNGYVSEKQGRSTHVVDENSFPETQQNRNKNGYVSERQGMSDTRFLENGRYYYDVNKDVKNENSNPDNQYFESTEENEFDNNEYGKGYNENEHYGGNNNGYMAHERRGYNYNRNGNTKKLPPNQYDTMEEYDKEEEYRLSQQYKP